MSLWGDLGGDGKRSLLEGVATVLTLGIGWVAAWAVTSGRAPAWAGGLAILGLVAAWALGRRCESAADLEGER